MTNFPDPGGDFLKDESRYRLWRETRLQACPQSADQIHVKIDGSNKFYDNFIIY